MSCNIQIHVYVFLWFQTSVLLIEVYTSFVFPVNKLIHLLNNASDDLFAVKSQISKWQKTSTLYSLKKYKYMYIISNLSISELKKIMMSNSIILMSRCHLEILVDCKFSPPFHLSLLHILQP